MIVTDKTQSTFRPDGDVVASSVAELRSTLRELVSKGVQHLVIDLTNVSMIDSSGLGLLMSAHNSLKKTGGTLSIEKASPEILELLTSMRIHQHLTVSGQ